MPGRTTHGARARRIYWLDPHRAGPFADWPPLLERVQQLGFDAVLLPPPFAADEDDATLVHDHARGPRWLDDADASHAIERVAHACRAAGLAPFFDLPLDRVAIGGALHREQPDWFVATAAHDAEPPDPRRGGPVRGTATLRWHVPAVAEAAVAWLHPRLADWVAAGIAGFRCLAPHRVPASAWRELSAAMRRQSPRVQLLAWTPGLTAEEVAALRGCGFDATFLSLPWWNFRDAWLVEEHARLAAVAPPIAPVVAPTSTAASPADADVSRTRALRALWSAAALGNGVLVPQGFECAHDGSADPVRCREVKAANVLAGSLAKAPCRLRAATGPDAPLTAIARESVGATRLVLLNPSDDAIGAVDASHVLAHVAAASARFVAVHPRRADVLTPAASVVLEPGAVHVHEAEALAPVRVEAPAVASAVQAPR
ncbi:MAG TPA: hypothetical protein VFL14_11450, partial [Xanthomonadales bacterium]|nr:hypothetical protein [Xanthomonadales bacterium]